MPTWKYLLCTCALGLLGGTALAGSRSGGTYAIAADSVDGGGQPSTSVLYRIDGSIGGIGGISSNAAQFETLKGGYPGQLTEVTNVAVIATPATVNEGSVLQFSGLVGLDDATVSALEGSNILWAAPCFPIASITPAGTATAAIVWSNTCGSVTGAYRGVTGSGWVLVLDSNPDNFGLYAGDQVPDGWQVRYFGPNNPLGAACATNCTGQNNLYTYTADLDPTNPASSLQITALSNQPPHHTVCFGTTSTGRVYQLLYATNLANGVWTNLPGQTPVSGLAGQMLLADTNAAPVRFYRVQVRTP